MKRRWDTALQTTDVTPTEGPLWGCYVRIRLSLLFNTSEGIVCLRTERKKRVRVHSLDMNRWRGCPIFIHCPFRRRYLLCICVSLQGLRVWWMDDWIREERIIRKVHTFLDGRNRRVKDDGVSWDTVVSTGSHIRPLTKILDLGDTDGFRIYEFRESTGTSWVYMFFNQETYPSRV